MKIIILFFLSIYFSIINPFPSYGSGNQILSPLNWKAQDLKIKLFQKRYPIPYFKKSSNRGGIVYQRAIQTFRLIVNDVNISILEKIHNIFEPELVNTFLIKLIQLFEFSKAHVSYNAVSAIIEAIDQKKLDIKNGMLQIEVSYNFSTDEIEFQLSDNGIGIEKRVFEKWYEALSSYPSDDFTFTTKKSGQKLIGGSGIGIKAFLWPNSYQGTPDEDKIIFSNLNYSIEFKSKNNGKSYEIIFPKPSERNFNTVQLKESSKSDMGTVVDVKFKLDENFIIWSDGINREHFERIKEVLSSS